MSIESDLRAALLTDTALSALIGQKLAVNVADQSTEPPYIVFSARADREFGLSNVRLGQDVSIEFQCWGRTAASAASIADALEAAILSKTQAIPVARSNAHDDEVAFDAVIVSAKLLID